MEKDTNTDQTPTDDQRTQLEKESGVISWTELMRHFARGVVIKVGPKLDLVEAAICLSNDDTATLQTWLTEKSVSRASDDDARDWTVREPEFFCIVAAPWVLVQECPDTNRIH